MANELTNRRNSWLGLNDDGFFGFPVRNFFRDDFGFPNVVDNRVSHIMKTDVSQTDKAYTVKIDLPGLKKENIQVEYSDGVLTVSGKQEHEKNESNDEGEVIHSERYYGSYSRQYSLPNVDREAITAKYDGGVLTLTLPKAGATASSHKIEIQ